MTKQRNVFRVPNVRIGDGNRAVRFKLLNKKSAVRCATRGEKAFTVTNDGTFFFAKQRGNDTLVKASDPATAFAKGVKTFWTLW